MSRTSQPRQTTKPTASTTPKLILDSLAINLKQTIDRDAKISDGQYPQEKLDPKYRLLSQYNVQATTKPKLFTLTNVNHIVKLRSVINKDGKFKIESDLLELGRSEQRETGPYENKLKFIQTMTFTPASNQIEFHLRQFTEEAKSDELRYNFISKYKYDSTQRKFVIDPYTTDENRIIRPTTRKIYKLRKHNNFYVIVNKLLMKLDKSIPKITFDTSYTDIIALLESQSKYNSLKVAIDKTRQSQDDQLIMDLINNIRGILDSEESFNKYKEKLEKSYNDYNSWSRKSEIAKIAEFPYMFTIKNQKPKTTPKFVRLLERLKSYDQRIILESDTETVITPDRRRIQVPIIKPVTYGVYRPYLVSDILRDVTTFFKNDELQYLYAFDYLPLTSDTINEFANFIHNFKSASFEILSLYFECLNTTTETNFSFKHYNIYPKHPLVKTDLVPIHEHNIVYNPYKSAISEILFVIKKRSADASTSASASASASPVSEIKLLPLDEPLFGEEENSLVQDFDMLYVTNPSALPNTFTNLKNSISSDIIDLTAINSIEDRTDLSFIDKISDTIVRPFVGVWSAVTGSVKSSDVSEDVLSLRQQETKRIKDQQYFEWLRREIELKKRSGMKTEIFDQVQELIDELSDVTGSIPDDPTMAADVASAISAAAVDIRKTSDGVGDSRKEKRKYWRLKKIRESQGKSQEAIERTAGKIKHAEGKAQVLINAMEKSKYHKHLLEEFSIDYVFELIILAYINNKLIGTNQQIIENIFNGKLLAQLRDANINVDEILELDESLSDDSDIQTERQSTKQSSSVLSERDQLYQDAKKLRRAQERAQQERDQKERDQKERAQQERAQERLLSDASARNKYLKYKAKYLKLRELLKKEI